MSESPQGPGWWQSSDGRWYPPHTHPGYQQPATGGWPDPVDAAGQPAPDQPGPGDPMPAGQPAKSGGAPKVLLIAGGVVLVIVILGYVAATVILDKVGERLGSSIAGGECTLIKKADVDAALGGEFDVLQLGGFTKIATPVLDGRVLADATTCWATRSDGDSGRLVRIARVESSDAAQLFKDERTNAQGVKEDRGGGLSVESQPYFNKDVSFGDEAFCTTTDLTGASGMLVRRGNTLIYVSLTSSTFNAQADPTALQGGPIKLADDDAHCDLARALIEKVR